MSLPLLPYRARFIGDARDPALSGACVLYWMFRDYRASSNWALVQAQRIADQLSLPVRVCATLPCMPHDDSARMRTFQLQGLHEVQTDLTEQYEIPFHLLTGSPSKAVAKLCEKHRPAVVVCDFSPLREPSLAVEAVAKALAKQAPVPVPLLQVDAHNVVPCWHVAPHNKAYSARVFRSRMKPLLPRFLSEQIPETKVVTTAQKRMVGRLVRTAPPNLPKATGRKDVAPVEWAAGGTREGEAHLQEFIEERLVGYATDRNNPTKHALSDLSPWLHHGHLSAQAVVQAVQQHSSTATLSAGVEAFVEECVIRRELADNFCFYEPHYDSLQGAASWAKETLDAHRHDPRSPMYTKDELESASTHDELWNAAQLQMVREGKMHGFMRMYWAKKILEWAPSPDDALRWSNDLNDKYSLDGRDPNGYVGCAWSIMGTHDQGWREREIFGKVRYMNFNGCRRKFDVEQFIERYRK